jgi:hypothetical protein
LPPVPSAGRGPAPGASPSTLLPFGCNPVMSTSSATTWSTSLPQEGAGDLGKCARCEVVTSSCPPAATPLHIQVTTVGSPPVRGDQGRRPEERITYWCPAASPDGRSGRADEYALRLPRGTRVTEPGRRCPEPSPARQ